MAKNVMKLLKPSPHRQRNDFDLSHRHVFDANFGELLPATCIETVPGDNITLHASDLLRAIPFVSSPFLRAKQHLDVWFVPYHDLWHQFDAFITKKSEPVSAAFNGSSYCPYFKMYGMSALLANTVLADQVGRNLRERSYYLMQLLGYGDIKDHAGTVDSSYAVNPFRLAAYNFIWYNEYRQTYYDDGTRLLYAGDSPAKLFNFDDLSCTSLATADITSGNNSQNRRLAMMQMRYRTWKKDLFTGLLPNSQFGAVSTLSGGTVTGLTAVFNGTQGSISGSTGFDVDLDNEGGAVPGSGRWQHSAAGDYPDGAGFAMGDQSGVVTDDYVINANSVTGLNAIVRHNHTFSANFTPQGSVSLNSDTGSLSFDVLSLRRAEALQIWRENALRAGNHIKDNMLAHYGVASDFNDHRPTYLGSVSAPLNIGDIATTANSGSGFNDTVGDIAGKGTSALDEKVFKFHAKDFGVIMVMFSILPEAEYDANGIERTNQLLEPEDFFMPEFENLGLEAVGSINIGPGYQGITSENTVIGYAPRYYGYKTKLDKVFGSFVGNGVFRTWSSQRSDVSEYYSTSSFPATPLSMLYVNPALFDANFNVGVSNSPQFLCDLYFDVDAVRPMSVTGMPFS